MSSLIDRKTRVKFTTDCAITENGTARLMKIEARKQFVVVELVGTKEQLPVPWELIYEAARKRAAYNDRLEATARKKRMR